jgi:putative endonuclease
MKYHAYILKSSLRKRYYIGVTSDLEKRIEEHNAGKTKSTRPYLPWKIIYSECFSDKKEAYKREWHLKHPVGYLEKIEIIKKFGRVA